jgi:hypothetical protein
MAEFYDISKWQEKPHFQTGGTRNKAIFENPDTGELHYFKTSLKKDIIDYKFEFWSEILASEIGRELGFNTLKYDIACHKDEIGCLSKSMVDTNAGKLSEGINYLRGYDPNYNPDDKNSYSQYTFHFIESALNEYRLKDKMKHLVTTIIFDSLIGNGDRHQENWGFIVPNINLDEKAKNKAIDTTVFMQLVRIFHKNISKRYLEEFKGVFAPIYDSGSCLGRELSNEKVNKMLKDKQMIETYLKHDHCEIRWKDEKISHFDLINHIKEETIYKKVVENEIKRVIELFNIKNIEKIIAGVDKKLPEKFSQHKLPENRKILMGKFVSLRFERLKQILK